MFTWGTNVFYDVQLSSATSSFFKGKRYAHLWPLTCVKEFWCPHHKLLRVAALRCGHYLKYRGPYMRGGTCLQHGVCLILIGRFEGLEFLTPNTHYVSIHETGITLRRIRRRDSIHVPFCRQPISIWPSECQLHGSSDFNFNIRQFQR